MTYTVLLFASYADAFGAPSVELTLPPTATVADVVTRLRDRAALPPTPIVAVNQRFASYEQVLADGDEIAIIPPVAGG